MKNLLFLLFLATSLANANDEGICVSLEYNSGEFNTHYVSKYCPGKIEEAKHLRMTVSPEDHFEDIGYKKLVDFEMTRMKRNELSKSSGFFLKKDDIQIIQPKGKSNPYSTFCLVEFHRVWSLDENYQETLTYKTFKICNDDHIEYTITPSPMKEARQAMADLGFKELIDFNKISPPRITQNSTFFLVNRMFTFLYAK